MDCYIKQLRENDCAFASLKMLLAYYSKNKEYLYLEQDLDADNYNLWDIISIAKKYGVEIQGVKITSKVDNFNLDFQPFLALLEDETNGTTHLVFVRKIKKKRLLIYDPKNGKYWLNLKKFYKRFSRIYLRVISYNPSYYKSDSDKFIKKKGIIFGNILKAFSSILLVVGFYFVKEDTYFIVPLAFVVGFVILSLISNLVIKRSSYKFDKDITSRVYSRENKNFPRKYEELLQYKTMIFTSSSELLTNLLMIGFLIVVTCINDFKNMIFISALIIFALLDYFIFKRIKTKCANRMERYEEKLSKHGISEQDFKFYFTVLNKETNKFSTLLLVRKYFVGFFIFALVFVLMAISKIISLNYLIFNFLIYDLIFQYFHRVISYEETNEQFKLLKAKFVSLLKPSK